MRSPVSSFRSIEWNVAVSRLLRPAGQATTTTVVDAAAQEEPLSSHPAHQLLLQQAHFVLPSLPSSSNNKAELRSDWLELIPQRSQRMQTIVACQYTAKSLEQHLRRRQDSQCTTLQSSLDAADRFLVVGGNEKLARLQSTKDSKDPVLTSSQAIQIILDCRDSQCTVWAVVNPNSHNRHQEEHDDLWAKLEAGATGIITQPLLSSRAAYHLEQYYHDFIGRRCDSRSKKSSVSWVVGMALPQNLQRLLFWLKLVGLEDAVDDDIMVKDHVAWFSRQINRDNEDTSLAWIQRQHQVATNLHMEVHGLHWMPMNNTVDLMEMLQNLPNSSNRDRVDLKDNS